MSTVDPIRAAIADHRQAWDAFQVAPEGKESVDAECAMRDAMDALVSAACAFPVLSAPLPESAGTLLAHLRWWLAEEAELAEGYQPSYAVLQGRAADLAAMLEPSAPDGLDPIRAVIAAAEAANAAHTAALDGLDEDDDVQMRRANARAHATRVAFEAVQQTTPATLSGLLALTEFYARDAELYERSSSGGDYLRHIASVLTVLVAREARPGPVERYLRYGDTFRPRERLGLPGQSDVKVAWHALPVETRDRIGIIATDMVFQAFVHGDDCVAVGQPRDRPVPGRSKAHRAIRAAADDACNARLTELHKVIEGAIPVLFGPAGENPEWAVAMGALR